MARSLSSTVAKSGSQGRSTRLMETTSARLDIEKPSAWDAIVAEAEPAKASLYYHGTLALRGESAGAEASFVRALEPDIIFLDVNLRPPWWQPDAVRRLLRRADWVKLNRSELLEIHGDEDVAAFMRHYDLQGLVLTHGAEGAEIITATGDHVRAAPDRQGRIVDTVGAGDAFASVIILGLVRGWSLDVSAERAQAFASAIVGQRGATVSDRSFYRRASASWQ